MSLDERIHRIFQEGLDALAASAEVLAEPVARSAERIVQCFMSAGKVVACGNGGAAASAQHFVSRFVNRFEAERPGLPALALNTDTALLSSIANDYDYSRVFARQIEALGAPGDLLLAISTSGNSRNILEAVRAAQAKEMGVIALTGRDGGQLAALLREEDVLICVPTDSTARILEVHLLVLHSLCDSVDYLLLGA